MADSMVERYRRALEDTQIDLECLVDYDGLSEGAKAVVRSTLKDIDAILKEEGNG